MTAATTNPQRPSWNGREVGIGRDQRAIAEREDNGGNLYVDLLHRSPSAAKVGKDPSELPGRVQVVRPQKEVLQSKFDTR